MLPVLYDGTSYTDSSFGLGVLSDAISAEVEEERNSIYELTMRYPISGKHYSDIALRRIIKAKPNFTDNPQLFRIYRITKPISGVITIYARHISQDLSDKLVPVGTSGSSCIAACAALSAVASPFTITTDKSVTGQWKATEPASVRAWFGGRSGSLLDVFGTAEWYYNGLSCQLLQHRGNDRGVVIRYGKNLTDLTAETSCENMASSVLPYYIDTDGSITTAAAVSTGMTAFTRQIAVDFSSEFDETPTTTQLRAKCREYIDAHNFTTPEGNITLDFVQIGKLKDRVDLCDTVTIEYEQLGVSGSVKCIRTVWDVLNEKYTETEFGDAKTTAVDTIVAAAKEAENAVQPTTLRAAVDKASAAIKGQNGGFFVQNDTNNDGYTDEVLFMNTLDIDTATKVWRWNLGGLGYSSTGYDGTYGLAITANGEIVADFITAGTLNAGIIKAGLLQDEAGLNYWNMETGEVSFNVSGTVQSITTYYAESIENEAPPWEDLSGALFDRNGEALYDADNERLYVRRMWTTTVPTSASSNYRWMRNYVVYKDGTSSLTSATPMQDYYGRANLVMKQSTDRNGNPIGILSGLADYMRFDAGQLEINSPQFTLDREGNASFAGAVTATSLTLGGGVDIDVDRIDGFDDAANGVIEGTVTASFVNALGITAQSVAAENITGTTISGKRFESGMIYYDDNNYWNLKTGEIRIKSFATDIGNAAQAAADAQSDVDGLKIGISIDDNGVTVGRQNAAVKGVFGNDSLQFQNLSGTPLAWLSADASEGLGVDLIQIGSHDTVSQRWIIKTESSGNRMSFTRRAS